MNNQNTEMLQKDLKKFHTTIITLTLGLVIILGTIIGWLNYWNSLQTSALKKLTADNNRIRAEIVETKEKMQRLLQWNTLQEFKNTETALINYFTTRVGSLHKSLLLEFLEEITPPQIKYSGTITVENEQDVTFDFYSLDVKGLGEYYYKLLYYQKLWLIQINSFSSIELKPWEMELLQKYGFPLQTKHYFSTKVTISFVPERIREYYYEVINEWKWPKFYNQSIMEKAKVKQTEDMEGEEVENTESGSWKDWILVPYPIEPLDIPDNITIKDVLPVHTKWREAIEKKEKEEREAKKNIIGQINKDISEDGAEESEEEQTDNGINTSNLENAVDKSDILKE